MCVHAYVSSSWLCQHAMVVVSSGRCMRSCIVCWSASFTDPKHQPYARKHRWALHSLSCVVSRQPRRLLARCLAAATWYTCPMATTCSLGSTQASLGSHRCNSNALLDTVLAWPHTQRSIANQPLLLNTYRHYSEQSWSGHGRHRSALLLDTAAASLPLCVCVCRLRC